MDTHCRDGNACTQDACLYNRCVFPNREDGTTCNDGNFCTTNDQCTAGVCSGTRMVNCGNP